MTHKLNIKNFSTKFIDVMIGIVLGLGFQWWVILGQPWQYIAFIFVYIDIVDYWIDYGPSLKKFPPKKEVDILLDLAITFSLFLYIFSTQKSITFFLIAFCLIKFFDFLWLLSSKIEYKPTGFDLKFIDTWMRLNSIEIIFSLLLIFANLLFIHSALVTLIVFIVIRVIIRIAASLKYKKLYLTNT